MNVNSLIEDKFINDHPLSSYDRKTRDRLRRQEDILRAAERIFSLKGYHDATMFDIAKEAQYAIGTVYLYFKDKDALYLSLLEQKFNDLLSILREETAKAQSAKEKIEIFIYEKLSFFERNQDFFRIFISERIKPFGVKAGKHQKPPMIVKHKEFVTDLIKLAQEQRLIRTDFPARQIADVLISVFMSVVFNWLKEEPKNSKNLSHMSGFIFDIFLNGARKNK